ncbi:MAG: hypothetical protein NTW52_13335 [Planctomycetota bacterium]|nr:hypothetical protein [Planctomycetota bacterium]
MSTNLSNPIVKRFLHNLVLWAPLWLGSTFLFGLLGATYAFVFKEDSWLASQAFIVRDEANGAVMRLGRFESQSQMKASQETILEMSKNHQVVREALEKLGPETGAISWFSSSSFPSNTMVASYATNVISVHAPKGTEFGVSEVIYLDIKLSSPKRAADFNKCLCDALEERLRQVRKSRAESIIAELRHARDAARVGQTTATKRLQEMEAKAGLELGDLRGMTDMIAGGSNSRTQIDIIKSELRSGETQQQQLLNDIKLIKDAIADPSGFLVTPSELVNTQPGLKKLREGYADAQISASQLSGRFTEQHPIFIAAKTSQLSIREKLVEELQASLTNREQELKLIVGKQDRLKNVLDNTEIKLGSIAENRAEYANLISEVKTRTTILESAERELAEATASSDASLSTSLITRLDEPVISDKPIGPGRTTITALCTIAGLVFGLGLVFVIVPSEPGKSFGRRLGDMGFRRRSEDLSTPPNEQRTGTRAGDPVAITTREMNQRASDRSQDSTTVSDRRKSNEPSQVPSFSKLVPEPEASTIQTPILPVDPTPTLAAEASIPRVQVSREGVVFHPPKSRASESRDQVFRELSSGVPVVVDQKLASIDANSDAPSLSSVDAMSASERRQHPRSTKSNSPATPTFGLRPSTKN